MRRAQLAQDRRGRGGVGRRDDGAQRDGGRPRHRRASTRGRPRRRPLVVRPTATTTRLVTGSQLSLQIARRRVVGGIEQHRRDEQRQRELRRNCEARAAGQKRQQRAADREEGRIGRAHAARRRGERGTAASTRPKNSFEFLHARRAAILQPYSLLRVLPTHVDSDQPSACALRSFAMPSWRRCLRSDSRDDACRRAHADRLVGCPARRRLSSGRLRGVHRTARPRSHRITRYVSPSSGRLDRGLCHWSSLVRPPAAAAHQLDAVVDATFAVHEEPSRARSQTSAAQPPLRAPPASPALA